VIDLMKLLLVNATKGFEFLSPKKTKDLEVIESSYVPPIGLLYLANSLENGGHSVEVIDFYNEKYPEKEIQNSLASADAVGFSVYPCNYTKLGDIANKIKKIDSSIPIIIGGPHCTFHPDKALLDIPAADISIEGEAELVINSVIEALYGAQKLTDIPGVYYWKNSKIRKGKKAKIIEDLDALPFPSRHLVDKYEYGKIKSSYFYKQKVTSILTSRGCPFRCKFCSRNVMPIKTYRERSAENVIKEFQEINSRYSSVLILDDNFLVNKKRIHKIMDELIEMGISMDLYILGARGDIADRHLYKKMKKAGVKHIQYGIESGNQDILNFYNKKVTLNQIRNTVNLASKMNMLTIATFIFGAPIETEKHIIKTIKFACSLPLDIALFQPLAYQHGSDLWSEATKQGKIKKNDEYIIEANSLKGLGNFTSEELTEFCKFAFKKFYLRPEYILKEIFKSILRKDLAILKIGINFL